MEAWSYAQYVGETKRERERKTQKLYFQNSNSILYTTCVCVQCTRFIQVLTRTDRSTIVLQCSLRAPTLTPKYIPSGISFLASSVLCTEPAYPIGTNRLGSRPNRSVPTDSVLGFFSRLGRCWACISTDTLYHKGSDGLWWRCCAKRTTESREDTTPHEKYDRQASGGWPPRRTPTNTTRSVIYAKVGVAHGTSTNAAPLEPFQKWGLDFIDPFTPVAVRTWNRYILVTRPNQ